jgi:hypothetical protein
MFSTTWYNCLTVMLTLASRAGNTVSFEPGYPLPMYTCHHGYLLSDTGYHALLVCKRCPLPFHGCYSLVVDFAFFVVYDPYVFSLDCSSSRKGRKVSGLTPTAVFALATPKSHIDLWDTVLCCFYGLDAVILLWFGLCVCLCLFLCLL